MLNGRDVKPANPARRALLGSAGVAVLGSAAARLEAVSPMAVLARGYALVTDPAGHPLTSAAAIAPGSSLRLRFADGEVGAKADGGKPIRQGSLPL